MTVSKTLADWYNRNKRELPWRGTLTPYNIWLSEIILQQTRINQGYDYYLKFIESYPSVIKLAEAPIDEVLKLWQGLGYYSRARNLHETAQKIAFEFQGEFPPTYCELIKLKGIGPYTAAAIASICFREPVPSIDGNVYRFLSRYFGIELSITSGGGLKEYQNRAMSIMDQNNPGNHNQAMIDFGALQCVPVHPDCNICPLKRSCYAYLHDMVKEFPPKQIKINLKKRYFNYLVIQLNSRFIIGQRTDNDIWKMLFEFPLIETKKIISAILLMKSKAWKELFPVKTNLKILNISDIYKHILSHQVIYARFIRLETDKFPAVLSDKFMEVEKTDLGKYAIPRLIEKYLLTELNKEKNNIVES